MAPRRIKKDRKEGWIDGGDGRLVNPNSEEGLILRGLKKVPDDAPMYAEEIVPANSAAAMASAPSPEDGLLLYKKLPGDCEAYRMHVADDSFPDAEPLVAVTCDTDDVAKVLDSVLGDGLPPRYLNPKTGLEFEWTTPPPGFYVKPKGWDSPKVVQDFAEAEGDDDDKE